MLFIHNEINIQPNNETYFSDDGVEVPLLKTKSDQLADSVGSFKSTSHDSEMHGSYGSLMKSSNSVDSMQTLPNHIAIKVRNISVR